MIKLNNLSFAYKNNLILEDVDLELTSKTTILVGESGSGKTTFALLLNAIKKVNSGSITLYDYEINSDFKIRKNKNIRRDISYVWQIADTQIFNATVYDEIIYNIRNFNLNPDDFKMEILKYFTIFNLPLSLLANSPFKLSGGQKKKISIISAILQKPKLLILDEPTVSLDPRSRIEILEVLNTLALDVLIITHDNELFNLLDNKKLRKYTGRKSYLSYHYQHKMFDLLPLKYHYGNILGLDFEQIYHTKTDKDFVLKFGDICKIQ